MIVLNKTILFFLLFIVTTTLACTNTPEKKKTPESKKEVTAMVFPKHPGTIKMITMLDMTVKIISIEDLPETNQFVLFDENDVRTEIKSKAVKATPIVEERMYSRGEGEKLVPVNKADYLWIESYGPNGVLLKTNTLWRNGKRGG